MMYNIKPGQVQPVNGGNIDKGPSLQWLAYIMTKNALNSQLTKQEKELEALKTSHGEVKKLHQLQQLVKLQNEDDKELTITEEIKKLIEESKTIGTEIPEYKNSKLNREERTDLYDRLRITIEDKSTDNNMRMQMMSRITNVLNEMYGLARSIMRTLSDTLKNIIRAIAGR